MHSHSRRSACRAARQARNGGRASCARCSCARHFRSRPPPRSSSASAAIALEARVSGQALDAGAWIAPSRRGVLSTSPTARGSCSPPARARLGDLTHDGARASCVEAGGVEASVVHRSRTNYLARGFDPFAVDVTGTKFDVSWDPTRRASHPPRLREGSAIVSGCLLGSGRPVMAGETLRAWCRDQRLRCSASEQPRQDDRLFAPRTRLGNPGDRRSLAEARRRRPDRARPQSNRRVATRGRPPRAGPSRWPGRGQYQEALAAIGTENFAAE